MVPIFFLADKQSILGQFKMNGSKDRDVMYTLKQSMIESTKFFYFMSWVFTIIGGLISLTIIGAFVGVPMILATWWLRNKIKSYHRDVESVYLDYISQNKPTISAAD